MKGRSTEQPRLCAHIRDEGSYKISSQSMKIFKRLFKDGQYEKTVFV